MFDNSVDCCNISWNCLVIMSLFRCCCCCYCCFLFCFVFLFFVCLFVVVVFCFVFCCCCCCFCCFLCVWFVLFCCFFLFCFLSLFKCLAPLLLIVGIFNTVLYRSLKIKHSLNKSNVYALQSVFCSVTIIINTKIGIAFGRVSLSSCMPFFSVYTHNS